MTSSDVGQPAMPGGWHRTDLVQIGTIGASAWVCPGLGGNVVDFAVHVAGTWRHLYFSEGREALLARPTRYGCPVLFPFPGQVRDATYRWAGETRSLPVNAPDGVSHVHGFAHTRPWRVIDARQDRLTLEFSTLADLGPDERQAYPFEVVVRQDVAIADGALSITLAATNHGAGTAPVGLGLHPYLSLAALGNEQGALEVSMPGSHERTLAGSIPTGELHAVRSPLIRLPESGSILRTRTGPGLDRPASIQGENGLVVEMFLTGDWRDLTLYAPEDQASVSLEPTSCEISAGSLIGNDWENSSLALPPGACRRATMTIRARHHPVSG